jgi:flagella basal body P-ring formation protein FlgA
MMARLAKRLVFALAVLLAGYGAAHGEELVVAQQVIYPGQTVTSGMLREVKTRRKLNYAGAIVRDPQTIVGMVAQRTIIPGRPILPGFVRAPYLVEAGQPVTVYYRGKGLEIAMTAIPLGRGGIGDVIQLRNQDSGQTISATVLADGSLQVTSP